MKGSKSFKTGLVKAVGLMSGTSLDGVDAAELVTDGEHIARFGASTYRAYSDTERATLRAALGKWPGDGLESALDVVQSAHVQVLQEFTPELVGFHGQTLAHEPRGRGTHQLGDGDALAQAVDAPVVWDFRSNDVQLGGEGAPLAPFFHFACA
ncbi:anhydro-N-acetylmuramic acid kinase, partial [Planktotalea sp.]|uniref:anhydro-N-acetylmuramic acid kinase n=1 Tax=Planktotalea sp. TaxID=2029877 RepID=UPI0035C8035E